MATVNFSIPDEVKEAFNATFAGCNKSALIAQLMMGVVEEEQKRKKRALAIDRLVQRRSRKPPVALEEIRTVREEIRS